MASTDDASPSIANDISTRMEEVKERVYQYLNEKDTILKTLEQQHNEVQALVKIKAEEEAQTHALVNQLSEMISLLKQHSSGSARDAIATAQLESQVEQLSLLLQTKKKMLSWLLSSGNSVAFFIEPSHLFLTKDATAQLTAAFRKRIVLLSSQMEDYRKLSHEMAHRLKDLSALMLSSFSTISTKKMHRHRSEVTISSKSELEREYNNINTDNTVIVSADNSRLTVEVVKHLEEIRSKIESIETRYLKEAWTSELFDLITSSLHITLEEDSLEKFSEMKNDIRLLFDSLPSKPEVSVTVAAQSTAEEDDLEQMKEESRQDREARLVNDLEEQRQLIQRHEQTIQQQQMRLEALEKELALEREKQHQLRLDHIDQQLHLRQQIEHLTQQLQQQQQQQRQQQQQNKNQTKSQPQSTQEGNALSEHGEPRGQETSEQQQHAQPHGKQQQQQQQDPTNSATASPVRPGSALSVPTPAAAARTVSPTTDKITALQKTRQFVEKLKHDLAVERNRIRSTMTSGKDKLANAVLPLMEAKHARTQGVRAPARSSVSSSSSASFSMSHTPPSPLGSNGSGNNVPPPVTASPSNGDSIPSRPNSEGEFVATDISAVKAAAENHAVDILSSPSH